MESRTPVIIINYRNPKNTLKCVESLRVSKHSDTLFPIVVESGDDQKWAEALRKTYGDWVQYVPQKENLGFSGANNAGIRWALNNTSSPFLVLLNDDATVAPDALDALLNTLKNHPQAGAVVPKIFFSPGKEFHTGYKPTEKGKVLWYAGGVIDWKEVIGFHRGVDEVDHGQYDKTEPTEFATGCCVALRVSALKEVGLFDERYFLYLEDLDLSCRLLKNNWSLLYEPTALVWHDNAGSSGSGSSLHEYYFVRNRFLFGFRYATLRTRLFLLKHLGIQWQKGSSVTKQAIFDFITGKYGKRNSLHH